MENCFKRYNLILEQVVKEANKFSAVLGLPRAELPLEGLLILIITQV